MSASKALAFTTILKNARNLNIGPVTVDDPIDCPPLQAADIFAYELSRHLRFGAKQRPSFQRILEDAAKRGTKVTTLLWSESFRSDPRMSDGVLPGTILPFPEEEV